MKNRFICAEEVVQELSVSKPYAYKEWKTYKYDSVAISGVEICEANSQSLYLQVPHENGVANIVTLHGQAGVVSGVDQE